MSLHCAVVGLPVSGEYFIGGLDIERFQSSDGFVVVFTVFDILEDSWANVVCQ